MACKGHYQGKEIEMGEMVDRADREEFEKEPIEPPKKKG